MIDIVKKAFFILTKKQRTFSIVIAVMMFIGALLESVGVSLIYPIVKAMTNAELWDKTWYGKIIADVLNISEFKTYLIVLISATIIVFIVKNAYLMFESWVQINFVARCRVRMQKMLMNRYLYKPYMFFLGESSGKIVRIITGDTAEAFGVMMAILNICTNGVICIILAATTILMNPTIATVFIAVFVINFVVVTKLIKPRLQRLGNISRDYNAKANRWILESINGIKSIKVSDTEGYFQKMYQMNAEAGIKYSTKSQLISMLPKVFNETFSVSAALSYVLVLVICDTPMNNIIPVLSVFAIAALRMMPCINGISGNINGISGSKGALDNVIEVLKSGEENSDALEKGTLKEILTKSRSTEAISFNDSIELSNINFSYPRSENVIIEDGNLTIKKGESVGFVGVSGGGKTTTADIVLGLINPCEGEVLVDGKNIEDNIEGWHSLLSYVPQQVFLMDDTIRANVAFGIEDKKVSDEKVMEAIKAAQLDELVSDLPDGLDSIIGERGMRLSGGQCQRIGIARALYRNPEIIVFDEATSALDNETEKSIMKSIDNLKGQKTMIIIAHRLTTIRNCDTIYRVEDRKITRES